MIFVLSPPAVVNWFLIGTGERESIENRCDAVLSPKLWNEDGIRNRLDQLDKLPSPEVCRAILDATGGWPFLLDHLFETAEKENNLSEPSERLKRELLEPTSALRGDFEKATSLGTWGVG